MVEKEHKLTNQEKETSFKYSTGELGKRFEKEALWEIFLNTRAVKGRSA